MRGMLDPLLWVKSALGEVKHSPSHVCIAGAILCKDAKTQSLAKTTALCYIYIFATKLTANN
jgi:hypothetical protein